VRPAPLATPPIRGVLRDTNGGSIAGVAVAYPTRRNYDVTPDGQRFLMLKRADNGGARLTVVQGLTQLIRQHMPPAR
jgi:hypothetical protein